MAYEDQIKEAERILEMMKETRQLDRGILERIDEMEWEIAFLFRGGLVLFVVVVLLVVAQLFF